MSGGGKDDGEVRDAARVEGAIAAVDQMMDVVDGFEAYVLHSADRDEHGTRYRLNLLWIHAFAALLIAPLMSATGRDGLSGPSLQFLRTLPGTPYSLSALIGCGGLVLGMGCVFRAKRVETFGLTLLLAFYLLLAVSLAVPPIRWMVHGGTKSPMYAPIVYLHLTVIMSVHIWGLAVRRRDERVARNLTDHPPHPHLVPDSGEPGAHAGDDGANTSGGFFEHRPEVP